MMIGLPRAMLYYKYERLWETFFRELGCETVTSGRTTAETLAAGVNFSIDECCLPAKIYMGHVHTLLGKCDYILVPRVTSFGKEEVTCVKFNALYDIARNVFEGIPLLGYNLDVLEGDGERKGFLGMGKALGKSRAVSIHAYEKAKAAQRQWELERALAQQKLLEGGGLNILLVTHPYNIYDDLIGRPIVDSIKQLGGVPIYADACDRVMAANRAREFSSSLYWSYNKELTGSIAVYRDKIDGVILLAAFPCGPDSLVNELLIRRLKNLPVANIVLDELQGQAGLQTRIESFMDIIRERKTLKKRAV